MAERALSNPATPSPTPNPSAPHQQHTLHPDQIMAGLSGLGGDEGTQYTAKLTQIKDRLDLFKVKY